MEYGLGLTNGTFKGRDRSQSKALVYERHLQNAVQLPDYPNFQHIRKFSDRSGDYNHGSGTRNNHQKARDKELKIDAQTLETSAEQYSKISNLLQAPKGINFMDRLLLQEGMKVLDLGCGTGNLTAELAKRVGDKGHVVGVDPSYERIQIAKSKHTSENMTFVVGDGENFPEDKYDLVFCAYVLHWIRNKEAVFKRVDKNLRPGGQFGFSAGLEMPSTGQDISSLMHPQRRDEILFKMLFFVQEKEYEDMAAANRLTVSSKEVHHDIHTFDNVDDMLQFWFAVTYGVFDPTEAGQDAMETFKQKYSQVQPQFNAKMAYFVLTKE